MLKKLIGLLTILIIAVGFCGCMEQNIEKQTPTASEAPNTIKVVDLYGREVEVPKEVNRIVCCGPGCLRLIVYLNATDKVVGVEDTEKKWTPWTRPYRIAHPELANLPTIGQGGPCPKPNPEAIIQVKPDVIFVTYMPKDEVDALQQKLVFQ